MSTQKHTPGPWNVAYYGYTERPVIKHGSQSIADVRGCELDDTTTHSLANARLIAAAPDLLAALKLALPCVEYAEIETASKGQNEAHDKCLSALEWIREAIAKAEGNA